MTEQKKTSFWTRLKWVFLGKPVSYEEQRAAQARHASDPMTQAQMTTRNQRFHAGGI